MLLYAEVCAEFHPPGEMAHVVTEIVGSWIVGADGYLLPHGRTFAQVAVEDFAVEVTIDPIADVWAEIECPSGSYTVGGRYGNRKARHAGLGNVRTRETSFYYVFAHHDGHVVVFHLCPRAHALHEKTKSGGKSPFRIEILISVYS